MVPHVPAGAQADACATTASGPRTLKRDNVTWSPTRSSEITPTGIVTADGVEHEVDVIIYGTGFQASHFLSR